MPHYLVQWKYKISAIDVMVEAPQDRAASVRPAVEAFEGKLVGFYFSLGEYDGVAILDMPSKEAMTAFIMTVLREGALDEVKTTSLLTSEESVEAMKMGHKARSGYAPPQA